MDTNAAARYVVVGSDGKIIQKYQFVSPATGAAQYVPIMTIGPNSKLIPVRDKVQNTNTTNVSIVQTQEISEAGPGVHHENVIEKQQEEKALNQEISRPEKKIRGDREVECAKSCRACCNIDDGDFEDNKQIVQPNTSTRTWGCSRCGSMGNDPSSSSEAMDGKSSNNFPLVLGLVPASNQKTDSPPKGRFQCKVCFKLFTQKVNLTTHERIHLGERPYQCKVCLKAFTQQSNLVTHERIHTGERPYQCQVCMKRFTQRQNLTAHERIHLGERPFRCQVCQKAFTQRQNLVAHERIHYGERPYQCQVCLKSFTQQQNLTAHERIHSGFRQFSCSVCQKSFTQEQNLTKHMLTHTGEKPYPCQFCSKSFAQQSNLTTHERTHLVGNSSSIEGPDRKRKVFVYTEQELTSQMEAQQSEVDSAVVQTGMNSLYPPQSSQ